MKELDEIDRLFQEELGGFEALPDASVKANIDEALLAKKRRKGMIFWFLPLLLALGIPAFFVFNKIEAKDQNLTIMEASKNIEFKSYGQRPKTAFFKSINKTNKQRTSELSINNSYRNPISAINPADSRISKNKNTYNSKKGNAKDVSTTTISKVDNRDTKWKLEKTLLAERKVHVINEKEITSTPDVELTNSSEKKELESKTKGNNSETTKSNSQVKEEESLKINLPKKESNKWALALYSGYDITFKKERTPLILEEPILLDEFANRYRSTFYTSKLEFNRRLNFHFDIAFGFGYQLNTINKQEKHYFLDSVVVPPESVGTSTTLTDSFAYVQGEKLETQKMRISSLVLPIGISYYTKLSSKVEFRLSASTEMSFGKLKREQDIWIFSNPNFQTFGINVFLRPELVYNFKKLKVGVHGTINQPIRNQLIWSGFNYSFTRFGGGISVHYPLK
jgi:hypothetical protein